MSCDDKPWVVADLFYGNRVKWGSPIWKKLVGFIYKTKEEAQAYLDSVRGKCSLDYSDEQHEFKVMDLDEYMEIEGKPVTEDESEAEE